MLTNKKVWILFIVTVFVVGAAVLMRQSQESTALNEGGPYFSDLLEHSNDAVKAVIKQADATTTIERQNNQWTIREKDGYPASTAKVRELILGLARLKRVEPKTKNPALYAKLDLNDISEPGSGSKLIQLVDSSGQDLALVVLGKSRTGGAGREQFYVRSPDDPQAWLVEGFLPAIDSPTDWIETTLIEAEEIGEVRKVTIVRDDETMVVARTDADSTDFQLQGLARDEEIESQYAVNQIAQSFRGLNIEDVRPASVPLNSDESAEAIAESFDGVSVRLKLYKQNGQNFARLRADYTVEADADEALAKKVAAWNDLWEKWIYQLPDYQVESIFVAREALLKQQTEPAQQDEQDGTSQNVADPLPSATDSQ